MFILIGILIFGLLIAVHELGHFLSAKFFDVRVTEFSIGMGPAIYKKERGETLYTFRILPIGGFCAMDEDEESTDPRSFGEAAGWKKIIILSAGAIMNFVVGFILCIAMMFIFYKSLTLPVIDGFFQQFPAEMQGEQGLMPGDQIYKINGERIYIYDDITLMFGRSTGDTMDIEIIRDGTKIMLDDYPLYPREYTEQGEDMVRYGLYFQRVNATFGNRLQHGIYSTFDFIRIVRLSLGDLIHGKVGLRELSGPVGIVDTIAQVGSESESILEASYFLFYITALIAVNLGVMNLLPLPALDGGRIFFVLLNGVLMRTVRRKIPARVEGYFHNIGMLLLLLLMAFVMVSDVGKLFGR